MENESPRRAVTGHTFEPKEPQRRKENKHSFWKTCKEALSRDRQQSVGVCGMATWEGAHSRGFRILSKAELLTSKLSFQIPS